MRHIKREYSPPVGILYIPQKQGCCDKIYLFFFVTDFLSQSSRIQVYTIEELPMKKQELLELMRAGIKFEGKWLGSEIADAQHQLDLERSRIEHGERIKARTDKNSAWDK